jgi:hypothetical protein
MSGAYPHDESSESDLSDTNSIYDEATRGHGSPTQQLASQQDEVMDALGNTLQSSFPTVTGTSSTRGISHETIKQALEVLDRQIQQDALQGPPQCLKRVSDRTVARLRKYTSTKFSLEGFAIGGIPTTPPTKPSVLGSKASMDGFFNHIVESSTTTPPSKPFIFGDKTRSGRQLNRTAKFSATSSSTRPSLFGDKISPGDEFTATTKSLAASPDELKWPVQASATHVQPTSTTDPPDAIRPLPKTIFGDNVSSGGLSNYIANAPTAPSIFNALDKTPAHPVKTTPPVLPRSLSGNKVSTDGLFDRTAETTDILFSPSKSPVHPFASFIQNSPSQRSFFSGKSPSSNIFSRNHTIKALHTPGPNLNWPTLAYATQAESTQNAAQKIVALTGNIDNETQGGSSKRQSGDLRPPDSPVTDDSAPVKRPFSQKRVSASKFNPTTDVANRTTSLISSWETYQATTQCKTNLHPVASRISSSEDFVAHALQDVSLNGTNMDMITQNLRSLYELIMSLTDGVISNTRSTYEYEKAVSDIDREIKELVNAPGLVNREEELNRKLKPLNLQKEETQCWLETNKTGITFLKDNVVSWVLASLALISKHAGSITDEKYVSELLVELAKLKDELKKAKESHVVELEKRVSSVEQKAAVRHRNELNEKLARCALDQETALRQLKDQYAARINDAETKFGLHKKATAKVEELEASILSLQREKSDLMSAKATVEKQLDQLEIQAKYLRGYEEAYNQIVTERDQLQGEYYDVVAERDEIRQAQGDLIEAPDKANVPFNGQAASILQTGTLQSYDRDIDLLESYWTRQENFAEMALRDTAAEIRVVDARLDEIVRQLRYLEAPDDSSDAETGATDPDEETDSVSEPIDQNSQSQLLDTLTYRLPTTPPHARIPTPGFRSATSGMPRRTRWADKAAMVGDNQKLNGQGYVHSSYHGHGVSTVKRIDFNNM